MLTEKGSPHRVSAKPYWVGVCEGEGGKRREKGRERRKEDENSGLLGFVASSTSL